MDHFRIPKNPARSIPRVRYYCTESYDGKEFLTYPERMGWSHDELMARSTWVQLGHAEYRRTPEEAASFLQQWLFFGLLHVFFGNLARPSDFIETDNDCDLTYIHTRGLLEIAQEFMKMEKTEQNLLRKGLSFIDKCLEQALEINERIVGSTRDTPNPSLDPYFIISLAGIARFLACVAESMYQDHFTQHRDAACIVPCVEVEEKRFGIFKEDHGTIDILSYEMARAGWCPRQVSIAAGYSLETQYFCSQLRLFEAQKIDHGNCTQTQCLTLQVLEGTYEPKHVQPDCKCNFAGVNEDDLDAALECGYLPLITLGDDDKVTLACTDLDSEDHADYIAISHVWSDGLGNPHSNSMPMCQLQRLKELIQYQEHALYPKKSDEQITPLWIDTLCCPARQGDTKKRAIKLMGETYRKAADTLVLSADLMGIDITDLPIIDSLHYISLSAWVSRLWTLQEGCLSRTLHIRFKNSSLRYDPLLRDLLEHQDTFKLGWVNYFDLTDIENRIRGGESRLWQLRGEYAPGKLFSVTDVAFALARRSTSVIQDEALCLGSLLGADMGSIAKAPREDRMKTLLTHLPSIPQGLLFWNGPKMEEPGFRWAPRSFMGIDNPDYIASFDDRDAKITPRGLMIKAPGLILDNLPSQLKHDIHMYLITEDRNGKMYHMAKHDWLPDRDGEVLNVFTVATPDYTHIALLCEANISDPERFDLFTESIMVFIYEVADGVTYARRGDSGMLSCQSVHAEDSLVSYIKRDLNMDAQEDVPKLDHGKEYLVHLGGRNMYAASYGTWDKEERLWCID